jgi:hypothetical protein
MGGLAREWTDGNSRINLRGTTAGPAVIAGGVSTDGPEWTAAERMTDEPGAFSGIMILSSGGTCFADETKAECFRHGETNLNALYHSPAPSGRPVDRARGRADRK